MITHSAKITLDLHGYMLTLPNDLSKQERHTLIGIVFCSDKLGWFAKMKVILALMQFGRTQVQ